MYETPHQLRYEYADFIQSFPWDVYTTITFREKRKDAYYWSTKVWDFLEKFDASRSVVACEPHRLDGIHFHCLSRHLPPLGHLDSAWKYAFKAFGRSRLAYVVDSMPVSRYCAKYIVKENNVEFYGDKSAWVLDKHCIII